LRQAISKYEYMNAKYEWKNEREWEVEIKNEIKGKEKCKEWTGEIEMKGIGVKEKARENNSSRRQSSPGERTKKKRRKSEKEGKRKDNEKYRENVYKRGK